MKVITWTRFMRWQGLEVLQHSFMKDKARIKQERNGLYINILHIWCSIWLKIIVYNWDILSLNLAPSSFPIHIITCFHNLLTRHRRRLTGHHPLGWMTRRRGAARGDCIWRGASLNSLSPTRMRAPREPRGSNSIPSAIKREGADTVARWTNLLITIRLIDLKLSTLIPAAFLSLRQKKFKIAMQVNGLQ